MAKRQEKIRAIALRQRGLSYDVIAQRLNVSKSTLQRWLSTIRLSTKHRKRLRCRGSQVGGRIRHLKTVDRRKRVWEAYEPPFHNSYFTFGLGLYWGEGTRYGHLATRLANANPAVIHHFICWIQRFFPDDFCDFRLEIRHYGQKSVRAIRRYWAKHTKLPAVDISVKRTSISRQSKKRRGQTLPYGTAYIAVRGKGVWQIRHKIEKALQLLGKAA